MPAFDKTHNYYADLKLPLYAGKEEIKKAYRKLALECHPDKNPDKDAATLFAAVSNAYEVLSDDTTRGQYDRQFVPPAPPKSAEPRSRRGQARSTAANDFSSQSAYARSFKSYNSYSEQAFPYNSPRTSRSQQPGSSTFAGFSFRNGASASSQQSSTRREPPPTAKKSTKQTNTGPSSFAYTHGRGPAAASTPGSGSTRSRPASTKQGFSLDGTEDERHTGFTSSYTSRPRESPFQYGAQSNGPVDENDSGRNGFEKQVPRQHPRTGNSEAPPMPGGFPDPVQSPPLPRDPSPQRQHRHSRQASGARDDPIYPDSGSERAFHSRHDYPPSSKPASREEPLRESHTRTEYHTRSNPLRSADPAKGTKPDVPHTSENDKYDIPFPPSPPLSPSRPRSDRAPRGCEDPHFPPPPPPPHRHLPQNPQFRPSPYPHPPQPAPVSQSHSFHSYSHSHPHSRDRPPSPGFVRDKRSLDRSSSATRGPERVARPSARANSFSASRNRSESIDVSAFTRLFGSLAGLRRSKTSAHVVVTPSARPSSSSHKTSIPSQPPPPPPMSRPHVRPHSQVSSQPQLFSSPSAPSRPPPPRGPVPLPTRPPRSPLGSTQVPNSSGSGSYHYHNHHPLVSPVGDGYGGARSNSYGFGAGTPVYCRPTQLDSHPRAFPSPDIHRKPVPEGRTYSSTSGVYHSGTSRR